VHARASPLFFFFRDNNGGTSKRDVGHPRRWNGDASRISLAVAAAPPRRHMRINSVA